MILWLAPWSATYTGNSFPVHFSSCSEIFTTFSRSFGSPYSPLLMWSITTSAPASDIR